MTSSPWWAPHVYADRRPFLLARNRDHGGARGLVRGPRFRRGRDRDPAGLARQRGASACLRDRADRAGREPRRRSICTPRRNSPPRSCSPPASRGSSPSRACSATASASALHHPEFTMLEWYRANEPYGALIDDCAALLAAAAEAAGTRALRAFAAARPIRSPRRSGSPSRRRSAATPASICSRRSTIATRSRAAATRAGACASPLTTPGPTCSAACWSSRSSRISASAAPTILDEYPVSEAALARPTAHDPRVAERFELYVCGVEIANAFGELTDPAEQRRRFESRDGREAARARRALSARRGFPRGARRRCRRRPASRSASTGW